MGQVFTSVSGNVVAVRVVIAYPADITLTGTDRWEVVISSKTNHGLGSSGSPDYPYYMDHFLGNGSVTTNKTYVADQYVAELALVGQGVVDYSQFVIAGSGGGGVLASIAIPPTVTVDAGATAIMSATCKNTSGSPIVCPALTWGSGNNSIATVSGGVITGIAAGTIPINCWNPTTGIASNLCQVTVMGVGTPKATIFNWCWKVGTATGACSVPRVAPPVPANSTFTILADVFNTGTDGKIRTVFKVDDVQIYSQEQTVKSMTMWSVSTTATMPNKNVGFAIEVYSLSGSTWTLNETKNDNISLTIPGCSNAALTPYSAILEPGSATNSKVTLTATVLPLGTSFPVSFVDDTGTVLGTCNTDISTGTCTMVFDSASKVAGTYNIKAVSGSSVVACTSNLSTVVVGVIITQYTLTIAVRDANTGAAIPGATVLVGIAGTASSAPKTTDASGNASFIVDVGTVSINVSKTGYNNYTTAEYVYYSKTFTVPFVLTPTVPTPGGIQFVTVPPSASIYLDGKTTSSGVTPLTINGLTAGIHDYVLRVSGYNDTPGRTAVQSGSVTTIYVSMPIVTPTTGSLNITSHPVMGAKIFVDGVDMNRTTSGSALITEIPPGSHSYKLTLVGYKDTVSSFVITAGINTFIDAPLVQLSTIGNVEISSTPSGAMVYIDGVYTNKITPAAILNLGAGSHTYKLTLVGYKDLSGTFNIVAGNVTSVNATMIQLPVTTGILKITSNPAYAKVYVDGRDVSKVTPAIIEELTGGNHTYSLSLVGYKYAGATVAIVAGETTVIDVSLELTTPGETGGTGTGTMALIAAGVLAAVLLSSKKNDGSK